MLKEILETTILSIGDYHLHIYEVVAVSTILGIGFLVDKIIKRGLNRSKTLDSGTKYAMGKVLHYLLLGVSLFFSTRVLGIDISPLLVGSSVILVGIGLGLQNLFLDFISGIIVLFERSIRVGDVLDINGVMGKVVKISMRTTKLLTTDNKVIIFPNSFLTKNNLTNYTSIDEGGDNSFVVEVSVSYDSDIELVQKLLINSALENPNVDTSKKPIARLVDFADSSLKMRLIFFSDNTFGVGQTQSEIRIAILQKFRENNITIPYPITTIDYRPN